MKNTFLLAAIISMIITSLSIGYYLTIYIPKRDQNIKNSETSLQQQIQAAFR